MLQASMVKNINEIMRFKSWWWTLICFDWWRLQKTKEHKSNYQKKRWITICLWSNHKPMSNLVQRLKRISIDKKLFSVALWEKKNICFMVYVWEFDVTTNFILEGQKEKKKIHPRLKFNSLSVQTKNRKNK